MQKLTKEEWETHISIDAVDGIAVIDASIPKDITKLKKLGYPVIRENLYEDGSICNVIFSVPRRCISFRGMEKKVISKEKKKEISERMKRYHATKALTP